MVVASLQQITLYCVYVQLPVSEEDAYQWPLK